MYYIYIIAVAVLDQLVKFWINLSFVPGESRPIIEGIFHLTYVQNRGAAFSILQNRRAFLLAVSALLIIAIFVFLIIRGKRESRLLVYALSSIAAGGLGNFIDRVTRGFVVDMFDFRVWPVFNVADVSVCFGCALLLIYVIFFDRKR